MNRREFVSVVAGAPVAGIVPEIACARKFMEYAHEFVNPDGTITFLLGRWEVGTPTADVGDLGMIPVPDWLIDIAIEHT